MNNNQKKNTGGIVKRLDGMAIGLRCRLMSRNSGMEMVQVAILIAIAVAVGIVFKSKISAFVDKVFKGLLSSDF